MRIIKIDDEDEVELYVIKKVGSKKFRIPVKVNENEKLRDSKIPNDVIMVKAGKNGFTARWNKGYEFKKAPYLETAQSIDELLFKLKERDDIDKHHVFSWEDGEQLL